MHRSREDAFDVIVLEDPWTEARVSSPPKNPPADPKRRVPSISWSLRISAGLLSALAHLLLIGPVLLGAPGRMVRPPLTEGGVATLDRSAESTFLSTVVFVNDQAITPEEERPESLHTLVNDADVALRQGLLISSIGIPTPPQGLADGKDEQSPTTETAADDPGRAAMFGRYMGQIKARIERAWQHPGDSTKSFRCTVEIRQDDRGRVKDVTLQRCDEDSTWQWPKSLVQAIEQASPLPAPPNEGVFINVITLSFDIDRPLLTDSMQNPTSTSELAEEANQEATSPVALAEQNKAVGYRQARRTIR